MMGMTRSSEKKLAGKIERALKQPKQAGRYDIAYKAEVEARLKQVCAAIEEEINDLRKSSGDNVNAFSEQVRKVRDLGYELTRAQQKLEIRVREIEMTRWQRMKRAVGSFLEDVSFALSSYEDPSFALDDRAVSSRIDTDQVVSADEVEDLEQRPHYYDGQCPDCKQTVGIVMQRNGDGRKPTVAYFDMQGEDVQIHICPPVHKREIQTAIDELKPLEANESDPHRYDALQDGELERILPPISIRDLGHSHKGYLIASSCGTSLMPPEKATEGWWCTRVKGHDGPCAAFPFPPLANPEE